MSNKPQDDELVMNLVDLALTRSQEEREVYLREACGNDEELFKLVWNYVQWEQRMGGFLLDPLYPPLPVEHPFEPEELLDERFRIVREVAQGGMGVVYEAIDEKLGRRIALKCAKTGFRKRLPPEVRHATEISHPNVCKIFEIHTAASREGEIDFLTMEFLDGETLAERLEAGRLPVEDARAIAVQLCAGLAEAHRNQVIHGDLKSNNVILTRGPNGGIRAVITDFGLARRPEDFQSGAGSGQMAGTPDYMAPELWKGAKPSVASDIYALGVILSQLGLGRRATRVVERCLKEDPARRFSNADQVARALAPFPARRWLMAAATAAVVVIATGLITYQRAKSPQESIRLAMLPVGSDAQTVSLAEQLSRDTFDRLAQVKSSARTEVALISRNKIMREHVDTTEKARSLTGATHVLQATLHQENDQLILDAYVTDVRAQVNRKQWKARYGVKTIKYAPVALAGIVTTTFQLRPLATKPVVNAAALQDYVNGLSYLGRDSTIDRAIATLERAVAEDPDSAWTYAGLAEAQWDKYNILTKDRAWLERAMRSENEAEIRDPDIQQVHQLRGSFEYDAGRYELAASEFRRAIELDPKNSDAYRRLGMNYEANNQFEDALAAYRQAVEKGPENYRTYTQLGAFLGSQSKYREAVEYYQKALNLVPDEPDAHFALGSAYMNLGSYGEAESQLRLAISLQETTRALHTLGVVLMLEGKDREAIDKISRALSIGPERFLWWMNLGTAYRRVNLMDESQRAYRRGLQLAEAEVRRNPRNGYSRSVLAFLYARLADKTRAESEIAQALQLSPNDADVRWTAAATYEALGRRDDTLAVLSASTSEVIADVAHWPDMGELHNDSRFAQLLTSRQIK